MQHNLVAETGGQVKVYKKKKKIVYFQIDLLFTRLFININKIYVVSCKKFTIMYYKVH